MGNRPEASRLVRLLPEAHVLVEAVLYESILRPDTVRIGLLYPFYPTHFHRICGISPMISENFLKMGTPNHQNYVISFAFDRAFIGL